MTVDVVIVVVLILTPILVSLAMLSPRIRTVLQALLAQEALRVRARGLLEDHGDGTLSGVVDGWPVTLGIAARKPPPALIIRVRGVCRSIQVGSTTRRTASPPIRIGSARLDKVITVRGEDEVVVRGMFAAPLREALLRAAAKGGVSVDRGELKLTRPWTVLTSSKEQLQATVKEAVELARQLQAPRRGLEAMVGMLRTDPDLGVRKQIATALQRAGGIQPDQMASLLESPDGGVHEQIELAAFLNDPTALPGILRNDMVPDSLREQALRELIRLDPGPGTEALVVELMADRKARVREAAFTSIVTLPGHTGLLGAVRRLSGRLGDHTDAELEAAADAFRLLAATEAVDVLFEMAFSKRPSVRSAALHALGIVGDLEHVETIASLGDIHGGTPAIQAIRAIQARAGKGAEGGEVSVFDADGLTGAVSEVGGGEVTVASLRRRRTRS